MPPSPPPQRKIKKLDAKVARTVLDTDACRDVVASSHVVKEQKLQEMIENLVPEAPKNLQPIEKYGQATPCGVQWDPKATTKKFQICASCQLHVYDFAKMDMKEVQNLVFSREGKEEPKFFRRADGKFLTADCPVGRARKKQNIILAITALCLIFCLFLFANLSAPPPVTTKKESGAGIAKNSEKTSSPAAVTQEQERRTDSLPPPVVKRKSSKQREYNPADIYRSEVVGE